jgi:hypothetical protein
MPSTLLLGPTLVYARDERLAGRGAHRTRGGGDGVPRAHVHEFGRPGRKAMTGFVLVEPEGVEDDAALARWVDVGAAPAASMPPK